MLTVILSSVVLLYAAYVLAAYVSSTMSHRNKLQNLPQFPFKAYPLIGHLHVFGKDQDMVFHEMKRTWLKVVSDAKERGKLFLQWLGPIPMVCLTHPDSAAVLFKSTTNIRKGKTYDLLNDWLGGGLAFSTGQKWWHRRRLITPSFHFNILDKFLEVMNDQSAVFVQNLTTLLDAGKEIDIQSMLGSLTLDIICETAMGVKVNAQSVTGEKHKYAEAISDIAQSHSKRFRNPLLLNNFLYHLTAGGRKYKKAVQFVHNFTMDVISKRMAHKDSEKMEEVETRKRLAFLDMLLHAKTEDGEGLSAAGIQEECDTFMFAGHDTNSAALTWGIYLLGRYQDVQEKVLAEIDAVFCGDKERPVTMDDLRKLTYLEQVIKETLRKYPPAMMIGRSLNEDCEIEGHVIPKDTQCLIMLFLIHHNEEIWEDAERFNPDRFDKENSEDRHPFAFVPFSAGPRNCIGQRFALQEQKVVLAHFFRNYRVVSHEEESTLPISIGLIVHPKNIVKLTLIKR